MNNAITYRGIVYPWQCDHVGHLNVMWYVGKFDEATWSLFQLVGITSAYLREHSRGMAAVDQHIEYRRELRPGDVVFIQSTVLELSDKKIRYRHEMMNAGTGEMAGVTTLLSVHMDTVTRKACPFPGELLSGGAHLLRSADAGQP